MGQFYGHGVSDLALDGFVGADELVVNWEGLEKGGLSQADAPVLGRMDEAAA